MILKRKLTILMFALVALFLLRGPIFRALVGYEVVAERIPYPLTDKAFLTYVENHKKNGNLSLNECVAQSRQITRDVLSFTFAAAERNPNELFESGRANCIGYAAVFCAVLTYLLEKNGLSDRYEVKHLVGNIHFLGINIHPYINHPFFKDHDIVQVTDLKTQKAIYVDPSLNDYFYIKHVRGWP